jgi:hypothetical protein
VPPISSTLDWSFETSASISWSEATADCASKGTLMSGMGVGTGLGFADEPEACWPGAVTPLEAKARRIRKTMPMRGCMEREKRSEGTASFCGSFQDLDGVCAVRWRLPLGVTFPQAGIPNRLALCILLLPRPPLCHGWARRLIYFAFKTLIFSHKLKRADVRSLPPFVARRKA